MLATWPRVGAARNDACWLYRAFLLEGLVSPFMQGFDSLGLPDPDPALTLYSCDSTVAEACAFRWLELYVSCQWNVKILELVRYVWIYEPYAATLGTDWSSWSYYWYSFLTIYSGVIINLSACSTCPTTSVLLVIFSLGFLLADWQCLVWTCRKHTSSFVRRLEPYVSFLSNVFTVPVVLQLSFTCFWCFWSAQVHKVYWLL